MTALKKYQRLESPGLWRDTPQAQLREVVVGLRETTLILSDPKTEMALAQWSLPALTRLNPGVFPALFAPDAQAEETVEVDDPDMIAALETVRGALERRRPRKGRLRGAIFGGGLVVTAALAVFWLPARLVDYTAAMLPAATRADLGKMAMADLVKLTGSPCASKPGLVAAQALGLRMDAAAPPTVLILREGAVRPIALPGNLVLVPAALVQQADGPDAIAGFVLAERLRAQAQDPTRALLDHAGLLATVQLLASGALPTDALLGFGQSLLAQTPVAVADEALLAAFQTAGISASPYAYALDKSGESTLALIESDPFPQGSAPPVLDDAGWLELQAICTE